jgi:hypothetical protein
MESKQNNLLFKVSAGLAFLAMVTVNALAQNLPINGVTPAEISDSYPNLFAPAGFTFSIWGLIYLLLFGYTLYQFGLFQGTDKPVKTKLLEKTRVLFIISSIANIAWIFSWHYDIIPLSMIFMVVILICLIILNRDLANEHLTNREKFFIRLPFSIYFGWITVATIANATTLLVSLGWDGFGIPEDVWMVMILLVGTFIGIAAMIKNDNIAYGLVLIWAYIGILLKHTSPAGFAGQYPGVIITVIVCLVLFAAGVIYLFFRKSRKPEQET